LLDAFALPAWMRDALCLEYPDIEFVPDKGDATRAKKICSRCPVRGTCESFAVANHIDYGICCGLSGNERHLRKLGQTTLEP
jgi:WhiB family redox-sensing transcriptional regulator